MITPEEMAEWPEAQKAEYLAAVTAAKEEEAALAEAIEDLEGSPAQRAIAEAKERAEKAKKERARIAREKAEKAARAQLRAQHGEHGVVFFPSKEGMIAMRVPSEKEIAAHAERVKNMPRQDDKNQTTKDFNRDLIVYPTKQRFDEIAKKYPAIWAELPEYVDNAISARDYTARPYD